MSTTSDEVPAVFLDIDQYDRYDDVTEEYEALVDLFSNLALSRRRPMPVEHAMVAADGSQILLLASFSLDDAVDGSEIVAEVQIDPATARLVAEGEESSSDLIELSDKIDGVLSRVEMDIWQRVIDR